MTKSEKRLVAIMVVVLGGAGALLFFPSGSPAEKATGPLLPKKQAEAKYEESKRLYKKMKDEQEVMQPRIEEMSYNRSSEELIPRLVQTLQRKAKQAGVRLREVKPLRPRPMASGSGERVSVEVRFRAPFQPNAVQFLYYLEDAKEKLVVEKLNITSADAQFRAVDVTVQVAVFTRTVSGNEGENANASATTQ